MKDYYVAIKFERACQVRRLLEFMGKGPNRDDDRYIHELRTQLDRDVRLVSSR